ncbi:hypothetical protein F2Q68_00043264 [Brassica cretica]|uniref:Uncharacterized protein n=1 Tax=Brassica cretica TaxID=69181 RepID=A0A8S9LTH4_BRACR|nr:hypothetical protein F2Q68_00043264 [Brassica cretica]
MQTPSISVTFSMEVLIKGFLRRTYQWRLMSYDDVKPYIERVSKGEPSNVIAGDTVTSFISSSGTLRYFPVNKKFFENLVEAGKPDEKKRYNINDVKENI